MTRKSKHRKLLQRNPSSFDVLRMDKADFAEHGLRAAYRAFGLGCAGVARYSDRVSTDRVSKGKASGRNLHYGICGEHGGDPVSVEFCHKIGLNYVSCSPFRVPIARLAAAQAAIKG